MPALRNAYSTAEFYEPAAFCKRLYNSKAKNIADSLHRMRQGSAVSRRRDRGP